MRHWNSSTHIRMVHEFSNSWCEKVTPYRQIPDVYKTKTYIALGSRSYSVYSLTNLDHLLGEYPESSVNLSSLLPFRTVGIRQAPRSRCAGHPEGPTKSTAIEE
jgi:hypothetical protein